MSEQIKKYYSYENLVEDVDNICSQIKEKKLNFKYIYGLPRGGLILAVILSHKLDLKLLNSLDEKHSVEKTLIVDEISDTGKTLKKLIGNKKYVVATIHYNTRSIYRPDIYCYIYGGNIWIDYFWEKM